MNGSAKLRLATFLIPVCAGGFLQPAAVSAQDASTYYTVMHPDEFGIDWGAFYSRAEKETARVRQELPHFLDLAYGDDRKQRLDLYLPADKPEDAPVFLFLHGGGFREGDRAQYGFIAESFAAHGIITAVASYRLTGDGFHYPDQPGDVRAAIAWLYRHVAGYGGDPMSLYVGGHSAGAILAADVGVDRAWLADEAIPAEALRGFVPVSGSYDLRGAGRDYTPTAEDEAKASPILHIGNPAPAAVIALGSVEDRLKQPSANLEDRLADRGVAVRLLVLEGQDHSGTVLALADDGSPLHQAVLDMILNRP